MARSLTFCQPLIRTVRRFKLAELLAYFLLAVIATWPLARDGFSCLPQGTESSATVPLFNTWTVWWNAEGVDRCWKGYWDAPIFHPTPRTFAFSEPMPTTVVVAPIFWTTGNRVLAYTSFLLLALTLNGYATLMLLRCIGLGWLGAAAGGAIVTFLPMVHNELGVLQLVPLCGIVWTIHAVYRFGEGPSLPRAGLLATAFSLTYFTCAYYGLFLSVLLLPAGGWLLAKQLARPRTYLTLLAAVAIWAIAVSPVVMVQRQVAREHELHRSRELVSRLSAEPADYLATPWPGLAEPDAMRELRTKADFSLGPGLLKPLLALVGVCVGFKIKRFRYWTAFCFTALCSAWILSLGPRLSWHDFGLYTLLMDWYPGFAQVRSAFRFAMFVQLMIALLAALGIHAIACFATRRTSRLAKLMALGAAAAVGVLAVIEVLPARQAMFPVPAVARQRGWIDWLKSETPSDCVVACVPFPQGKRTRDYEDTTLWMYWATFHKRRLVNGYSGFFPQSFLRLKKAMSDFPDERSLRLLGASGVTHCVVRRSSVPQTAFSSGPASDQLSLVFADDDAEVDIYRLRTTRDATDG